MRYSNLSSSAQVEKHSFCSNDYSFRETSLAAALRSAGLTEGTHLVREPKISLLTRERNDDFNQRDSRRQVFHIPGEA